jgi:transcriptional regulator with XRE-family HTH domain
MKDFQGKLRKLMAGRRLSQDRVARAVGVSQNQISLWVRGKSVPDLYEAAALARLFGKTVDYLADDSQDEPPGPDALLPDERAVLTTYRTLHLTEAEGLALVAALPLHPPLSDAIQGGNVASATGESRPAPHGGRIIVSGRPALTALSGRPALTALSGRPALTALSGRPALTALRSFYCISWTSAYGYNSQEIRNLQPYDIYEFTISVPNGLFST